MEQKNDIKKMINTGEIDYQDVAIVIPALNPDSRLVNYVHCLRDAGLIHIIVIDDGSSSEFQSVFQECGEYVKILHHDINLGKGAALKTGFGYISSNLLSIEYIVTADSDGQHELSDLLKVVSAMKNEDTYGLYIGNRDFNLPDIPFKSRAGNKITSVFFRLLYGRYLSDTQSGLRGFRKNLLSLMLDIKGKRYEYEMNMLINCSRRKIPIIPVAINTVYENNNEGTHFDPVRDSFRIYKVLLGSFMVFTGSSLLCTLIDQGLFILFDIVLFDNSEIKNMYYIFVSTVIARIISASINYSLNRKFAFESKGKVSHTFIRYALLCIGIMLMSALGTWLFSIAGLHSVLAKILIDTSLYFASYKFQQIWVFAQDKD